MLNLSIINMKKSMRQYDNYWCGNTEVKNSRVNFSSYITLDPTITIAFTDGSFIQ